jgi:L-lysine exporter family protein LysE/ArgO
MWMPFFQGMGSGAVLIVAIGAQNAFVLSQGVRRNHILTVALICSLCDALLIAAGVSGIGSIVASHPALMRGAALGGAVFLFGYGLKAFCSAVRGDVLEAQRHESGSLWSVILATLAVTLLNPHVYLDTLMLLGSISGQFSGDGRYLFGLGAMSASLLWFFSLSLGGLMLAPVFSKPRAWRVLDSLVGLVMWTIAASLIWNLFF